MPAIPMVTYKDARFCDFDSIFQSRFGTAHADAQLKSKLMQQNTLNDPTEAISNGLELVFVTSLKCGKLC